MNSLILAKELIEMEIGIIEAIKINNKGNNIKIVIYIIGAMLAGIGLSASIYFWIIIVNVFLFSIKAVVKLESLDR